MAGVFDDYYKLYKDELFRYFYRVILNSHTAEDLTQETFYRAFRAFPGFRFNSSPRTWIYRIASNTYISYMRKKRCLPQPDAELLPAPQDQYAQADERMLVEGVFVSLSPRDRELISLRDLEGFSYEEITEITGLSIGQVRMGLHRARKEFKRVYYLKNGRRSHET